MGTWSRGEMTLCDWCGKEYNRAKRLGSNYCSARCETQAKRGNSGGAGGFFQKIKRTFQIIAVIIGLLVLAYMYFTGKSL